jgi:GTPase SAR1 family protein
MNAQTMNDHNKRNKVKVKSSVLSSLTGLQSLILHSNDISDEGAGCLACVLSSLTGLQSLYLSFNDISDAGAGCLACVLSSLTGLQSLYLSFNDISDEGAGSLACILSSLTGLQILDLSGNDISAAGAGCFACGLSLCRHLNSLQIGVEPSAAVRCSAWLALGLPVPPAEVVSSGWLAVLHYLSSADKVPVHKIRMLVIGDSEMGKTSLIQALKSRDHCAQVISAVDRTVGIDICPLALTGAGPSVDALLYDLAGQDVYALSHAMHFTGRCMYLLLWKPGASMAAALLSISRWLETLSVYVPDAIVVLVGSHCRSMPSDEYEQLAACVQDRVQAKVAELNYVTELEVFKLHVLYKSALKTVEAAVAAYEAASSADEASKRAEESFQQWLRNPQDQNSLSPDQKAMSEWQLRSQARSMLSRSLRVLASRVHDAKHRASALRERLCFLLALRDGAEPHDSYPPATMTLHFASTDSVAGVGIVELKQWLHETCMQLKFMGELLPKSWLDVAHALPSLSNGVLTMMQATGQVRSALAAASVDFGCSDEETARILRFWSRVGEVFV